MKDLTTQILFVSILILSSVRTIYFYQLKEYRFDRLKDFFVYDSGFKTITSPFAYLTYIICWWAGAAIVFLSIPIIKVLIYFFGFYQYFLLFFLQDTKIFTIIIPILLFLNLLVNNIFGQRYRFKPTAKALLIFGLNSLSLILLTFVFQVSIHIIYLLSPFVLLFFIFGFLPVSNLGKELTIRKAITHMQKFPQIKVIAITGSYGKSSTKHYLYQVLKPYFNVAVTPKNINTDIGIAKVILNSINAKTELFIAECGAYRIGEIANSVRMFNSDYSILTAIAPQHLSLFGSMENITKGKSEIANCLKQTGILFLNTESPNVAKITNNFAGKKVVTYSKTVQSTYQVTKVNCSPNLSFHLDGVEYYTNLNVEHSAINLIPVIQIAKELGLTSEQIQTELLKLENLEATLNQKIGRNQATLLDDSYNSNIDGFKSAISEAKKIDVSKKILVTMGFVELGGHAAQAYAEIAPAISATFNILILTKPTLLKHFKNLPDIQVICISDPKKLNNFLKNHLSSDTLILIENRLNSNTYNFLLTDNIQNNDNS